VEKLSQLTNISEIYIEALIEEKFELLPPAPYVRGYVKKISQLLNLDGEKIWQDFLKNSKKIKKSGENDKLPPNRFLVKKKYFSFFILILIIIFIFIFYFSFNGIFFNKLQIDFSIPKENIVFTENNYYIFQGKINPKNFLTINNQNVIINKNGFFEYKTELKPGLNVFEFKIKNSLGDNKVVLKQVYYQEKKQNLEKIKNNNEEETN
ncbi:MAG: helix-turn-helix transcriptional regulator, partial [Candidatus Pacearchaeota archaeon]